MTMNKKHVLMAQIGLLSGAILIGVSLSPLILFLPKTIMASIFLVGLFNFILWYHALNYLEFNILFLDIDTGIETESKIMTIRKAKKYAKSNNYEWLFI